MHFSKISQVQGNLDQCPIVIYSFVKDRDLYEVRFSNLNPQSRDFCIGKRVDDLLVASILNQMSRISVRLDDLEL